MFYSGNFECVTRDNPMLAQFLAQCVRQQRQAPQLLSAFIKANKAAQARWAAGGRKRKPATSQASTKWLRDLQIAKFSGSLHAAKRDAAPQASNWGMCVHEAAHSVVALIFGAEVESVQVLGNGHNHGSADIFVERLSDDKRAIIALAGPCAESKLTGQPIRLIGSDLSAVSKAIRGCGNANFTSVWKSAAKLMISDPATWAAIYDVARELSVRKMMGGERVKDIVSRHVVLN